MAWLDKLKSATLLTNNFKHMTKLEQQKSNGIDLTHGLITSSNKQKFWEHMTNSLKDIHNLRIIYNFNHQ